MALTVVGVTQVRAPDDPIGHSGIALPPGTQAGDQLFVVAIARDEVTVADTRLTEVVTNGNPNGSFEIPGGIWQGEADGSGDPINVTLSGTGKKVAVAAIRHSRIVSTHTEQNPPSRPFTIPVVANGGAVIAIEVTGYSIVDGNSVKPDDWFDIQAPISSGKTNHRMMYVEPAPTASTLWEIEGTYEPDRSCMAVFGMTSALVAPPARLFPRDDDLGVGGGRIYPPPKSQQRSGRRFGYY